MTDNIKWDQLLRFRLIEIISLWEGRLTTNHLSTVFKIGRQQASRDIARYQAQFPEKPLILDRGIKGYKPSQHFSPKYIKGTASEYLTLLHQQGEMQSDFSPLTFSFTESVMLDAPEREIAPDIIRGLIIASREQRWVEVDYVSFSKPTPTKRKIVPHTIIHNGNRWHVRAFSQTDSYSEHRDFVLSRFRGEPTILEKSVHGKETDVAWNNLVTTEVVPNPYLTKQQQSIVASDHNMNGNKLTVEAREALMPYALKRLSVCRDKKSIKEHPTKFQLTVINKSKS